ncbi:SulP family inorganic anion transporter [uncultured Clostridium sp.]|uniref:SulP family inorganic anion transporter n=1 Tax=uncultured Clostridium sp. TaxID=59620 RepID=UPI002625F583|nr:SulP family inorganic anion transporter [uncultured Clostridium sp.]
MLKAIKEDWFSNIGPDLISAAVIGLVLIPETIGFAFIAGVEPSVSFLAVLAMSVMVALFGARKGMISASAGSMALVLAIVVRKYGVEFIMPVTVATGIIQLLFALFKAGRIVKYIPDAVMHGFVNALGILIFIDQIHYFKGQGLVMYILVGIGLLVIYTFPLLTKKIPAAIIGIIIVTIVVLIFKLNVSDLGDLKGIELTFPTIHLPQIAFTAKNIGIIILYAISLAIVGSVESLLTAKALDDMTGTDSNKSRECFGQGIGNIVTGLIGGMAGCALVGQSFINTKSGGKTRLSTLAVGIFLVLYVVLFSNIVKLIPIAAVVAVMIMIAITTFDWTSITTAAKRPITDTIVMIITVIVVLVTSDLAIGVIVGMILYYVIKYFKARKA